MLLPARFDQHCHAVLAAVSISRLLYVMQLSDHVLTPGANGLTYGCVSYIMSRFTYAMQLSLQMQMD